MSIELFGRIFDRCLYSSTFKHDFSLHQELYGSIEIEAELLL